MNKEAFNTLLEIQSCSRNIVELQQKISEENNRIDFVQKNINLKLQEISSNRTKLTNKKDNAKTLETELEDIQLLIDRTNKNLTNATTTQMANSAEKELEALIPKSEKVESSLFELWEEIEQLETIINGESDYEIGANKSLEHLKSEVSAITQEHESEVKKYLTRKEELLKELPTGLAQSFTQIEKHKSPAVCFMDNKKCTSCMTILDQAMISEINSHNHLCHCPTCGRILISPDVRY